MSGLKLALRSHRIVYLQTLITIPLSEAASLSGVFQMPFSMVNHVLHYIKEGGVGDGS